VGALWLTVIDKREDHGDEWSRSKSNTGDFISASLDVEADLRRNFEVLIVKPLQIFQRRLDVDYSSRSSYFPELRLSFGLGEVEDGDVAEGPVSEYGSGMVTGQNFVTRIGG
ncbi:hypothetical protein WHK05_14230, partial [Staphylococcus aureus]|uniref:hypothetical protein n=1 Tax=Staphylococcus aureus TaxID=1280 RepID=UPI0039BDEC30